MQPAALLPFPQQPATFSYPEADESSQRYAIPFFKNPVLILFFYPRLGLQSGLLLSGKVHPSKSLTRFSPPPVAVLVILPP